jgi:hypothetical protein
MMPFHFSSATSESAIPMLHIHLWHHALSNMALPASTVELHSLLELPTTDADGTPHDPRFVSNWQANIIGPTIRSLLASLQDDYELPKSNYDTLLTILNDVEQCGDCFSLRLFIAPSNIIHHSELLKLMHASLESAASMHCSINFKGAAAIAFRSIVNYIVDNTSFYMPPTTPAPPPPTMKEYFDSEARGRPTSQSNVTTRPTESRGEHTVTFDSKAPVPQPPAPLVDDSSGAQASWTNRRVSSSHQHRHQPSPIADDEFVSVDPP